MDEPMDMILRRESRRYWNGSKTAFGTEILLFGLEQVLVYPDVTYTDQPYTVHCKVDHETYQKIGDYAAGWKCSVRKSSSSDIYRSIQKKGQLGGRNRWENIAKPIL
ncbi:hypothetical protein RCO48_08320 [Peribacillus frigoritolerans]|nr:hypothetical protein [Peribacillus frigoritolerans]